MISNKQAYNCNHNKGIRTWKHCDMKAIMLARLLYPHPAMMTIHGGHPRWTRFCKVLGTNDLQLNGERRAIRNIL